MFDDTLAKAHRLARIVLDVAPERVAVEFYPCPDGGGWRAGVVVRGAPVAAVDELFAPRAATASAAMEALLASLRETATGRALELERAAASC